MTEIIVCDQGTPEWHRARLGIPTASCFATVMATGRSGAESRTRKTYMHKLAGEILTGEPMDGFSNSHTERGHEMEPAARAAYAFIRDASPELVGFIRNGRAGASPDSLLGSDGLLEIKTKLPHLMVETILRGGMPPEHHAQCQGQLWIAEREWVDIAVYWPGMPLFIHRSHRDEAFISELAQAVNRFNDELDEVVAKVRAYGEIAA